MPMFKNLLMFNYFSCTVGQYLFINSIRRPKKKGFIETANLLFDLYSTPTAFFEINIFFRIVLSTLELVIEQNNSFLSSAG